MNDRTFDEKTSITVKGMVFIGEDETRHVEIITNIAGQLSKRVLNMEEAAIREGLILLGWTPPDENETRIDLVTDHIGISPLGTRYGFTGTEREHKAYYDSLHQSYLEKLKSMGK